MAFEEVDYWLELQDIMDWADTHVYSTFFICWGAQAGLYHKYGIPKYAISRKMFGVYPHRVLIRNEKLLRALTTNSWRRTPAIQKSAGLILSR